MLFIRPRVYEKFLSAAKKLNLRTSYKFKEVANLQMCLINEKLIMSVFYIQRVNFFILNILCTSVRLLTFH